MDRTTRRVLLAVLAAMLAAAALLLAGSFLALDILFCCFRDYSSGTED